MRTESRGVAPGWGRFAPLGLWTTGSELENPFNNPAGNAVRPIHFRPPLHKDLAVIPQESEI